MYTASAYVFFTNVSIQGYLDVEIDECNRVRCPTMATHADNLQHAALTQMSNKAHTAHMLQHRQNREHLTQGYTALLC